jgi:cbb3-type cytochrome oxidase subunit 3
VDPILFIGATIMNIIFCIHNCDNFMKRIIFYLIIFFLSFSLFSVQVEAKTVIEGFNETVKEGLLGGKEVSNGTLAQAGVISSLPQIIGRIVGAGLAFLGVVFLLLMIYGGFIWMLARGNEQEVEKAKNLIQAAVIGLMIVLSAYAITAFIGQAIN